MVIGWWKWSQGPEGKRESQTETGAAFNLNGMLAFRGWSLQVTFVIPGLSVSC